jgi:amino acid adenylation domain-containing protein
MVGHLTEYLQASARAYPDRTAVIGADGTSISYGELDRRSDELAFQLANHGIERGDRVGVVLPKTIHSVISLFGIMKAGAAYVPVDVTAPAERARRILTDCQVRALVLDGRAAMACPAPADADVRLLITVGGLANQPTGFTGAVVAFESIHGPAQRPPGVELDAPDDLAYILYTSGSTGMPKGVMLTHQNAVSFVEWCSSVFSPTSDDRFSSHAPFHFDLSVLDIYVCIKHGATLCLISEDLAKNPRDLARFIAERRITVWYSTPSILTLLLQFGQLQTLDCSSLRLVLFAGEVFPVKHLREVKRQWPRPVYYNLYGPTETNVCTFARIPDEVPDSREVPYPIGFACAHYDARVLDEGHKQVPSGREGLLYVSGPSVFKGYWNRPTETAATFVEQDGRRWYNTGDVVQWSDAEGFTYVGRRDRMVKRRGYRIELGEIERALYLHPDVHEAAVVATADSDAGVRITAFVSSTPGRAPSIVSLKTFLASHVPVYMSPDVIRFQEALPRTSTDKTDYQALTRAAAAPAA